MHRYFFILILGFFVTTNSFAQKADSSKVKSQIKNDRYASPFSYCPDIDPRPNLNYLKGYWLDSRNILTAPFHWKAKGWITFGAVIGTTAGLYLIDQDVHDWVGRWRSSTSTSISHTVEKWGNGRYPIPLSIGLFAYGAIFKKPQPKRIALIITESYLLLGSFTRVIQYSINRHRPRDKADSRTFDGWNWKNPKTSFYSGHSMMAWMLSTILATEFKDTKWVPPLVYTLAALVPLSRVHDDAHWISDAFLGSCVGYFMTKSIMKRHTTNTCIRTSFIPYKSREHSGVSFSYNF